MVRRGTFWEGLRKNKDHSTLGSKLGSQLLRQTTLAFWIILLWISLVVIKNNVSTAMVGFVSIIPL